MKSLLLHLNLSLILLLKFAIQKGRNEYFLPSEFQICDGSRLRTLKKKFCDSNKLVFTANSTKLNSDCIGISGIWLIINRDCIPSVLPSKKEGYILSPHVKALQYLGPMGISDEFFSVVTISKREFNYEVLRPICIREVHGFVWLYSGDMYKSNSDEAYCASRRTSKLRKDVMAKYIIRGKLSVQYECPDTYKILVSPQLEYGVIDRASSECSLNCEDAPKSKLVKRKTTEKQSEKVFLLKSNPLLNFTLKRLKKKKIIPANRTSSATKSTSTNNTEIKEQERKATNVKRLVRGYHRHLLQTVFAIGLNKTSLILNEPTVETYNDSNGTTAEESEYRYPTDSFRILESLQDIVYKSCAEIVPKKFLKFAYLMFKTIYEIKGSNLLETLKKKEAAKVLELLNDCYSSVNPVIEKGSCREDWNVTRNSGTSGYNRRRHLTLEIPWKMVDLTVAVCIDAFGPSYILYHKMEQAMERLFTKDIRILWKRPPENEQFYTRLYGPHWKYHFERLESCVRAAYANNAKLSRLRRPDEISSIINSDISRTNNSHQHHKSHQGFTIPQLTPPKYQYQQPKERKSILHNVDLTCQPFDLFECSEQSPYSW